jgi:hypothetical protein
LIGVRHTRSNSQAGEGQCTDDRRLSPDLLHSHNEIPTTAAKIRLPTRERSYLLAMRWNMAVNAQSADADLTANRPCIVRQYAERGCATAELALANLRGRARTIRQ